jgi:hypothetical protein
MQQVIRERKEEIAREEIQKENEDGSPDEISKYIVFMEKLYPN